MKTEIFSKPIGEGHPNVKKVLEIAEEIMSKNKVLNVENLYNIAKKRLKLPRNGLLSIIQYLINKKLLIEGSKFSKESVLSNRIRNGILNYINDHPGIHFSDLRKVALPEEMGSSGQLVWHLEMLLKFNFITKIKVGNYTVFLPFEMDEKTGKFLFILRDRINNKVIRLVSKEKMVARSEIYKEIKEKREDVYYRINNLMDQEIIIVSPSSDKDVCLNPNFKEIINEVLETSKLYIEKNLSNKEEEV
jgi:predicted transcriptional regulator